MCLKHVTLFTIAWFQALTPSFPQFPPPSGKADAFSLLWDDNIRRQTAGPSGTSIRNGEPPSKPVWLHPDFDFSLRTTCPFRGKEQDPENAVDSLRVELLVDKFCWAYNPAPYIFGRHSRFVTSILI